MTPSTRRTARWSAAAVTGLVAPLATACSPTEPAGTFPSPSARMVASASPSALAPVTPTTTRRGAPSSPATTETPTGSSGGPPSGLPAPVTATPTAGAGWTAPQLRALGVAESWTDALLADPSVGSVSQLETLALPSCTFCAETIASVRDRSDRGLVYRRDLAKPGWGSRSFALGPVRGNLIGIELTYVQPPLELVDSATGKVVDREKSPQTSHILYTVLLNGRTASIAQIGRASS